MTPNNLAIVTLAWARDEAEEQLLRTSLAALAQLDVPVFVTDGGSGEGFLDFLSGFPHFTVLRPEVPGLWPQVKRSLEAAQEVARPPWLLYTEPDKTAFFRDHLPDFLEKVSTGEPPGVVLAARSAASFGTFPAFQQMTETTINACCAELIGPAIDYTYGPFLFNADLLPHLSQLPNGIGWGWRPYLFGLAHRLGYRVSWQERDLPCPPDQRTDDPTERVYRMRQLQQNIDGLVQSVAVQLP
jgi:hypothetical protein